MPTVMKANVYIPGELGSFGHGEYMLLRQEDFPDEYDLTTDKMIQADHDRCLMWHYDEFRAACKKWLNTGELAIEQWIQTARKEDCIGFLVDAMKADKHVNWTGFRVLGTVNRSNGYPVFSLYLFAKGKDSKTVVYSGALAPNVRMPEGMTYIDAWGQRHMRSRYNTEE
jgi:hypothetical protein